MSKFGHNTPTGAGGRVTIAGAGTREPHILSQECAKDTKLTAAVYVPRTPAGPATAASGSASSYAPC